MKLSIKILCLIIIFCANNGFSQNQEVFDLRDFQLYVEDASQEDFKISYTKDSIRIQKLLEKDLDKGLIKCNEDVNIIFLTEKIVIDFKQSTIDDNPAGYLNLSIPKQRQIKNHKEYILFSTKELEKWLQKRYFSYIKEKSIKFQTIFYSNLLKNKTKYKQCCPEYIEQAQDFFKTGTEKLNNFNNLNIFSVIKRREIRIRYIKKGTNKEIIIICEEG